MKRCPTCNKTFDEDHLSFCLDDGTPLVAADSPDDEATVVRSGPQDGAAGSSSSSGTSGDGDSRAYQPPGSYVSPGYTGQQSKRKVWPWVLGCAAILLVVLVGMAITARILFPRLRNESANANDNNYSANVNRSDNFNSNPNGSNSNTADEKANKSIEEDNTPPPTDEAEVLSNLTDLEHQWTVANINADKKKLDRILADDYVGVLEGKPQGKAEYLKTIKRDTAIQKWEFEDLTVTLKSDRATLRGTIRLDVKDDQGQARPAAFRFIDKFVWRDGRWQATGSEVNPLKTDG